MRVKKICTEEPEIRSLLADSDTPQINVCAIPSEMGTFLNEDHGTWSEMGTNL